MTPPRRLLTGWSRTAPTAARVVSPTSSETILPVVADEATPRGAIARGLGRSYGDAAQNAGGTVVDTTACARIDESQLADGILRLEAGVSLDTLMRRYIPQGWFVPVTPGTRHVSIGGAIAADIHGKNHHVDGSFSDHVIEMTVHTPTGTHSISRTSDPELFRATAGGLGLTGVVGDATIQMVPIATSQMLVDTERADNLDDVMARMVEGDNRYRYSVAWIDCLARGATLGRSVLTRGDHAPLAALTNAWMSDPLAFDPKTRVRAPSAVPTGLLNRFSIKAFNELWFRKAPRAQRDHLESITSFFHPLDMIDGWNRLYGSRGFLQYQYAVPDSEAETVRLTLERLAAAQCASFLAVLKRFGPGNHNYLSFPTPGWTLALDIPASIDGLAALLDDLDELIAGAGGRIYLAKDSRLRPELLEAMYPQLDQFRSVCNRVDPQHRMRSDLDRRLGIR